MTLTDLFGGIWLVCVVSGPRGLRLRTRGDEMEFGGFQIRLERSVAKASRLIHEAGTQVLTAITVAAAYRRAFRMSREFRRLPA
jgi:hypothetical protein